MKIVGRALHHVCRVGDRAATMDFYRKILQMKVRLFQFCKSYNVNALSSKQIYQVPQIDGEMNDKKLRGSLEILINIQLNVT